MNWADIGKDIATAAPIIGSILGGPVGAASTAVGSLVASVLNVANTPDAVGQKLKNDPSALASIRKAEFAHRDKLVQLKVTATQNQLTADTQRIQAVNKTMQAETRAEHWAQWLWRPLNGLLFAPAILALYVVLPVMHIEVPNVPLAVWQAWGALLGVTAWHEGMKRRLQSGDGPGLISRLWQAFDKNNVSGHNGNK